MPKRLDKRIPRPDDIRQKIQSSNPTKRWVKTPYGTFQSLSECSRKLKEFPMIIEYYCRKGKIQREHGLDSINTIFDYTGWEMEDNPRPFKRAVRTPDKVFASVADAARYYDITSPAICHKIRKQIPGYSYLSEEEFNEETKKGEIEIVPHITKRQPRQIN